ncbi:MAG: DUF4178 domain-containing protein [Acidobacteria bacterium]|nr:DUF4178 domain-containing protein [Acidobacteriota bacterium]
MAERVTNCPNCGAPVRFRWSSAIQTTCEYCRSILIRHDLDVELVGKVSDLPADPSPIQIGAEGIYRNKAFQVIGRIVYEYEAGCWNEWHLIFQDGQSGWLSDAQLNYAVSFLTNPAAPLAAAGYMRMGSQFEWNGARYQVSTITEARYVGVEGELPFEYWDKTVCTFVDLRSYDNRFGTIDYSEQPPLLFLGEYLEFDDLKLKNLKLYEGWY